MLFSSKISALEKTVSELTAERDALLLSSASVADLTETNAENGRVHAADQLAIATLTASNALLTTQLSDAAAAKVTADAGIEARVSGEVTKRLAHAGVDPIKRDPNAAVDPNAAPKTGTPRSRLAAAINAKLAK
jgi:hypothetical protein